MVTANQQCNIVKMVSVFLPAKTHHLLTSAGYW